MKKDKNNRMPTSQMNLMLRIVMGGMLIYIAYTLRGSFDQLIFIAFAVLFTVVGAGVIIDSLRRMYKGDFDYLDAEGNVIKPDDLDDLDEDLDELAEDVKRISGEAEGD